MTFEATYNKCKDSYNYYRPIAEEAFVDARTWTSTKVESIRQRITDTEFWKNECLPRYDRKIGKMDLSGKRIFGGSIAVACVIMLLARYKFNPAFYPTAMLGSFMLVYGAYLYSSGSVKKACHQEALKHLGKIGQAVKEMTVKKHQFGEIEEQYEKLQKPEFSHLEKDIENLGAKIKEFKTACQSTNITDHHLKDAKKVFLVSVNGLEIKLAPAKVQANEQPPEIAVKEGQKGEEEKKDSGAV